LVSWESFGGYVDRQQPVLGKIDRSLGGMSACAAA
jgi:hypothetical protein